MAKIYDLHTGKPWILLLLWMKWLPLQPINPRLKRSWKADSGMFPRILINQYKPLPLVVVQQKG